MSRPHVPLEKYVLRLFVHRTAVKSEAAIVNLTRVCEEHLKGRYVLEVIDIARHAKLARHEQIVAVPTLIKQLPAPAHRLVGDMSDVRSVLLGLNVAMREQ
jgi:circadian clock protein KaiB